jgi:threonine/homoserine/homoserine lactone efflux protein
MKSEKREFNRKMKRAGIFIGCYAVVALIVSTLLVLYTSVPQWLNGMIIVLGASVFYLIFLVVCAKIDKKKEEKRDQALKEKDPFAD